MSDLKIAEGELTTRVSHAASESGDAEGLARSSADENSWPCSVVELWPRFVLRDVAKVRNLRVMMVKERGAEWIDFGKVNRLEAERLPGYADGLDA